MLSAIISSFDKDIKLSVPTNPEHYIEIIRVDDPKPEYVYDQITYLLHHQDDYKKVPQPFAISDVLEAKIVRSNVLAHRASDVKQVYEFNFALPKEAAKIHYAAGNTIGILPENKIGEVKFVMTRILEDVEGIYRMQVITNTKKKSVKLPVYIPSLLRIEDVLLHCLDLNSIPKKVKTFR
jgi:sulfite reductase alpha subunit-like flavoprotein